MNLHPGAMRAAELPIAELRDRIAPPAVRFDGVTKRYNAVTALKDVSFTITPGEIVALVGPNGAGKSTLLEIMMGLRRPTAGRVSVLGDDVTAGARSYLARLGVQLQETRFFPTLTGREYLRFFRDIYAAHTDVDALVAELDLGAFAGKRMNAMSGGQRQRIALALALINDPDLVVLDEPTVGLDPLARRELWSTLRRVHARGRCTLLFSTHYMDEAQAVASQVLMLAHGSIIAAGSVDAVIAVTPGATNLDDAYTQLVGHREGASA